MCARNTLMACIEWFPPFLIILIEKAIYISLGNRLNRGGEIAKKRALVYILAFLSVCLKQTPKLHVCKFCTF